MFKYSIIIPIWNPEHKMDEVVSKCLMSVIENSSCYEYEIIPILNVKGYPVAVNKGLRRATGGILVVLNDDTEINDKEWLIKLSGRGIYGWRMHPFFITGRLVPDGACWAMSREVYEKLGDLDEQFADGYGFDDSDYWIRAEQNGILLIDGKVDIKHAESATFKEYYSHEKDAMFQKNEGLFREKHKKYLGL